MRLEHVLRRIERQDNHAELISTAIQNLFKIGTTNITRERIETRLNALEEQWRTYSLQHDAINLAFQKLSPTDKEIVTTNHYFQNNRFLKITDLYLDAAEIMRLLITERKESTPLSSTSSSIGPPNVSVSVHNPRLPRIDLPKFDGILDNWLSFRDLFSSLVISNNTISPVEKLQYLKTSLVGSAAHLLKNTTLTGENFDNAWKDVTYFYENERLLINSSLQSLFSIKRITNELASEIEQLYTSIMQVYRNLDTLRRPVRQWDDILVFMAVQRLDSESVKAWEHHLGSSRAPPTWEKFKDFLLVRMLSLQAFEKSQTSAPTSRPRQTSVHAHLTHATQLTTPTKCLLCSENHYLGRCAQFQSHPLEQRRDLVTKNSLCFNCLGYHRASSCRSTNRCMKCGRKHHTLIHRDESDTIQSSSVAPKTRDTEIPHQTIHVALNTSTQPSSRVIFLATAQVSVSNNYGETHHFRALLDQGSEVSLATEKMIQSLQLNRESSSVPILGIGAFQSGRTKGIVTLMVKPHFESSFNIKIRAHILPTLTSLIPSAKAKLSNAGHLNGLHLADPLFNKPGHVDLIIGSDYYGQLLKGSVLKGPSDAPTAQLTELGWIISGPSSIDPTNGPVNINQCSIDQELTCMLERFWNQEEIHTSPRSLSSMEQACEDHFQTTHSRDETGRYVVQLPFKLPKDQLGESKQSALMMLTRLTRKFEKNLEFHQQYMSFLNEYQALGHMRLTNVNDTDSCKTFYLPHHGVIKETSTTTKLRVVFNGSCPTINGICINEALHTGPKLQSDLFDVLIWQRQFKYIFTCDMKMMYRQIKLHPDDWRFQRILWKNTDGTVVIYELTTVTYGLACAPFLALRVIIQLIKDEGSNFPLAIDVLLKGRYIDDIFGGSDTINEAQRKAKHVEQLCLAGGFPLRKWITNHPSILHHIPSEHHASHNTVTIHDSLIHSLGLSWNPSTDSFHFQFPIREHSRLTKRSILSQIAMFFDPLGLLSPIFIQAKIFMQELWAIKLNWDDQLPEAQTHQWQQILQSLQGLEDVIIPRWIGTYTNSTIQLHGFCDASQLAMAAVLYIRTSTTVRLLCSKTKVAPLKRLTIPRLELTAAVMLTKLAAHCLKVLNLTSNQCLLWTDSSIVQTWISNHPSRWKEFVHNRVCFIQEKLPDAKWNHVPGFENPADCATRGLNTQALVAHSIWWQGPRWLTQDSSTWPHHTASSSDMSNPELETKINIFHAQSRSPIWDLLLQYSSLSRLVRITALCQRFIRRLQLKGSSLSEQPLNDQDIEHATLYWVKSIQKAHFFADIKSLQTKSELTKGSPLWRLLPFLDDNHLLRLGGRLQNAPIPELRKHPYLLPKDSPFSRLIIQDAHQRTLHGSTQDTLSFIRNTYWILGGRAPIRSYILTCVTCTRFRRTQAQRIMGQLPASRANPARAFLHSGVDYAGPFQVKAWKGRTIRTYKAWISVFICLSTSAVHLELVTDNSTESFIAAYKRFTARRGICATLSSDCGTNFKGADTEIKRLFQQYSLESQQLATALIHEGTTWKFIPPASPHFGGKWEAAVKSMKFHLRRVIGDHRLTYEELTTVIIQIEAVLNSRPLCPLTDDPDDINVLTPGHFLIGQALNLLPEPRLDNLPSSHLSRWQLLTQMTQSFWAKWLKEYLQRHQAVYKWNKSIIPMSEGSIVLILDERTSPTKWPLGRIIKLYTGNDGIQRVAEVRTRTTTLTRPIVKLCPLLNVPSDNSLPAPTKAAGNV